MAEGGRRKVVKKVKRESEACVKKSASPKIKPV
jgi:hypothetical protein